MVIRKTFPDQMTPRTLSLLVMADGSVSIWTHAHLTRSEFSEMNAVVYEARSVLNQPVKE